jgi:hypothetical protein
MQAIEAGAVKSAIQPAAAALALLEDHLNAVLRHGEALRALERPEPEGALSGASVPAQLRRNRQIECVAREAHALELAILLRLTQAEVTAREANRQAGSAAPVLQLVAVAASLVANAMPQGGSAPELFHSAGSANGFFASRGLGAAPSSGTAALGEAYLLGGATPLGAVMDAAAAALDVMDSLRNVATVTVTGVVR